MVGHRCTFWVTIVLPIACMMAKELAGKLQALG